MVSIQRADKKRPLIHYIATADFSNNPITSHVLGLMLIEDLQFVEFDNKQLQNIINKHLKEGRDVFECQNELMEAGLDEYAQL